MRYKLLPLLFLVILPFLGIRSETSLTNSKTEKILLENDTIHLNKQCDHDLINRLYKSENKQLLKSEFRFKNRSQSINYKDYSFKSNWQKSGLAGFIVPVPMIAYGILSRTNNKFRQIDISTNNEIKEHYTGKYPIDDYLQYLPAVSVYGLSLLGVKAKHNYIDRTILIASSYLMAGAVVNTMKMTINAPRPNGSNNNSFPSGHTMMAFVGAHILFKEYKDSSPALVAVGYLAAGTTGVMRIVRSEEHTSELQSHYSVSYSVFCL